MQKDLREFIELFNANGVRYVIVGGYALAFHGYPRQTGDVDFFVECSPDNARRIMQALQQFGFGETGVSESDFLNDDCIIQLGFPPNRIDITTTIEGVTFDLAWSHRVASDLDGLPVSFISKELLIRNKKASDRPQDRADIEALENLDS